MVKATIQKIFQIRDGELKIALLMQTYIFLIIATLLIIKPAVNSLFISELGVDSLPIAYLLIAISAIITSYIYTKSSELFSLLHITRLTLGFSIVSLIVLAILLHLNLVKGGILYGFYVGVAVYAVLATSQFWVLANLVFNIREAKRLFGFIGSGAIAGGIFGGYFTTILAPFIGNENLIFVASLFLLGCFPLLTIIWKEKVANLGFFKKKRRSTIIATPPLQLIRSSKHLTYLSVVIGISVITARLVDFQFSDIASKKIIDSDELTSFFGFWLSTFNVISLAIQLFVTRKIVGTWGVGLSLLILPLGILAGAFLFVVFPELWVVVLLKATDGSLKQSVNKSAIELIALPLPQQLKAKTKSFIDIVIDSIATGIAGFILIFLIKGLHVPEKIIMGIIMILTFISAYFIFKIRKQYYISFRNNLYNSKNKIEKKQKDITKDSFYNGMNRVFESGTEKEVLFMLTKHDELNNPRFLQPIIKLLDHPSNSIKAKVLRSLYATNTPEIIAKAKKLLLEKEDTLVIASLEYLLLHDTNLVDDSFENYLNNPNQYIAGAALICLAKECRDNPSLKHKYNLDSRIQDKRRHIENLDPIHQENELIELLYIIGISDYKEGYSQILTYLNSSNEFIKKQAIKSAGLTLNSIFVNHLLHLVDHKIYKETTMKALVSYDQGMIEVLYKKALENEFSLEIRTLIPTIISKFKSQQSVKVLLDLFINSEDLAVRLSCVKALSYLKIAAPKLYFDKNRLAKLILEECKLYNASLNAMHTQVIVHYLKRKKHKQAISEAEMEARESLVELLERRLDAGLERIFKLLELHYSPKDVQIAYQGIISDELEKRTNAIEFLEIILNPNLKTNLIPIIEASILDTSSEEVIEMISKNRMTEYECFQHILKEKDSKLKLAVLFLIKITKDPKYLPLLDPLIYHKDSKISNYSTAAKLAIESAKTTTSE